MLNLPLSSSELGNLWQAYQEKSLAHYVLEYLIETCSENETRNILKEIYSAEAKNQQHIRNIFEEAGAVIPAAFTESDVNLKAPPLFDDDSALMYVRMMNKVLTGLYSLHSGMSYRPDICRLYMDFTSDTQTFYTRITQYLLEKGVLTRPPIVPMPSEVEFVQGTDYTKGYPLLTRKRTLNTVEIGLIYQSLETNISGLQLMTGFEQVAKDTDAKKYFHRGKELAKEVVSMMSELLLDSDIPAPTTWAGVVTDSTIPPFSDRLMMYNTNLLSMFGLGSNSVGAAFSFRNDLLVKMGRVMASTFDFAKDGGEIMIKHGWMEEPPQSADREKLAHV